MKFFLAFAACFFLSLTLSQAQSGAKAPASDPVLREATDVLVAKYNFNADQAKQMYTILARKKRNMAQIAGYQTSDPAKYRLKLESIQTGTQTSVRRILHTREQVKKWEDTKRNIRSQRAAKQKELSSQGASKEAIQDALLAIFEE
jgi:hypothetical protein